MPAKYFSVFVFAVAVLGSPLAWGEESNEELKREIASLRDAIKKLEQKIETMADEPSEFSRVEVRVVDEDNRPVSGFKVSLTSADEGQRAEASGKSGEDGLALSRRLPYGRYWMSVSGGGWRLSRRRVVVELDKPLELTLFAPSSDRQGELLIESRFDPKQLAGLTFGGNISKREGKNWSISLAGEPGEDKAFRYGTFPSIDNGIENVGLTFQISLRRSVLQPSGDWLLWAWVGARRGTPQELKQPWFWLVEQTGVFTPLMKDERETTRVDSSTGFFEELARQGDNKTGLLSYHRLKLGESSANATSIRLPAGELTLTGIEIYGHPSTAVLRSMIDTGESSATEIWLKANIKSDSRWYRRLLGRSVVPNGTFSTDVRFKDTIELAAGATQKFVIEKRDRP